MLSVRAPVAAAGRLTAQDTANAVLCPTPTLQMLAFLYPSVPCAAPRPGAPSAARNHLPPRPAADGITSSSAERLLLLADKWDVPAVKLAVEHFVLAAWEAYSSPAVLTWPRPAPPPGRAPLGAAAGAAAGRAAAGRPRFELRSGCPAAAGSRLRLGQLPAQLRWLRLASEAELPRLFDAIASGIAAERAGRAYGGGGSSGAVSARARAAALLLDPLGAEEARADIRGLSRGDACALLERLLMGGPSGPPSRC